MEETGNFQDNQNAYSNGNVEEGSGIDIRVLWSIFLDYKWWFAASAFTCVLAAFIYLRYATPKYEVSTKVLIKDKENRRYMATSISQTFSEMGLMNNSNGFDNELEILATKTLNRRTVINLKSYVKYIAGGRVKDREIYSKDSPYLIDMAEEIIDTLNNVISVHFEDTDRGVEATVKVDEFESVKILKAFPSFIATPYGRVTIERNEDVLDYTLEKPLDEVP